MKRLLSALVLIMLTAMSAGAAAKSNRQVMRMADEAVEDYFNDKDIRREHNNGIRKNKDGSYTLPRNRKTMHFLMDRKGRPDKLDFLPEETVYIRYCRECQTDSRRAICHQDIRTEHSQTITGNTASDMSTEFMFMFRQDIITMTDSIRT